MPKKVRKGGVKIRMEVEVRIWEWTRIGSLRPWGQKLLLVQGRGRVGPGGGVHTSG